LFKPLLSFRCNLYRYVAASIVAKNVSNLVTNGTIVFALTDFISNHGEGLYIKPNAVHP
jgi:hypothetical protein